MQEWIKWCESAEDGEVRWVLCSVPVFCGKIEGCIIPETQTRFVPITALEIVGIAGNTK